MTLARSSEPLSNAELHDKGFQMAWLAQLAHLGMAQRLIPKVIPESQARLSNRDLAALRWTAEGKTSAEISIILNISERTVNFHISNAILKLNATNKTEAAVCTTVLGMLF